MTVQPTHQYRSAGITGLRSDAPPLRSARSSDTSNVAATIDAWARLTPSNAAITHCDTSITYHELSYYSNHLANFLIDSGVKPGGFVALYMDRSIEMVVAMLGVLKAGCAYVPLDPACPPDRIALITGDCGADVVLTHESLSIRLPSTTARSLCVDADWPRIGRASREAPSVIPAPSDLAYVIYTSGSTGTPKGVKISHANLANLLNVTRSSFGFGPADVWTVYHSYAFDLSVWEIWSPLTCGGRLVVVPQAVTQTPADFYDLIEQEKVTTVNLTPAALRAFRSAVERSHTGQLPPTVQRVIVGGEALPGDLAAFLVDSGVDAWNFYGPTEATVWATCHKISPDDTAEATVPIGNALPSYELYVLDEDRNPVDAGVEGELYIGGPGVAAGYLHRPQLTTERFIANPFSNDPDSRLYRTGDIVYRRDDGELGYVGRADFQVKIRGYRIELGEIEAVLNRHTGVDVSVVTAEAGPGGDKRLVAYVVASGDDRPAVSELRAHLSDPLPEYMIPAVFVFLDALPVNVNGKIDRKALPSPFIVDDAVDEVSTDAEDVEQRLIAIWERMLGIRPVAATDNFFDLGGDSLLALRLLAVVEEDFGMRLPLAVFFEGATVRNLAEIIAREEWSSELTSLVPVQPRGSRRPLFCIHGAGGEVMFYHTLARHLGDDQPLYGLQAQGMDHKHPYHGSVDEMARHYIHEMKTVQRHGPYRLAGASLGGVIAFEMAQQLTASGEEVDLLAFFDSFHPGYPRYRPGVPGFLRSLVSVSQTCRHHVGSLVMLPRGRRWLYVREKSIRAAQETWWDIEAAGKRFVERAKTGRRQDPPPHPLRSAVSRYCPKKYGGRIVLFRATEQPFGIYPDRTLGWAELAGQGIIIEDIRCLHAAMVSEPRVTILAEKLKRFLI